MSDTAPRTERTDYQATSDPALLASADRGESQLLDYGQLYALWERQQWATQDIDFTQDRIDWHERIDAEERFQRMYGLSSFFIGEQRVAAELGPMMRAAPRRGHADLPLHADRRRGAPRRVLRPLLRRGRRARVGQPARTGWRRTSQHLNKEFGVLFDEMLHSRVDRLAVEPEDLETLVEAVTIYHMVIEGMLALTGQHFIMDYNERVGTLPGVRRGLHEGGARRAPPRRVRRALPARHGPRDPRYVDGDPAHAGRGRARSPTAS